MQKAANLVRGWVEIQVTGASPEEFFNLLARENFGFWRPRQVDATTWTFRVSIWDWHRVPPLALRARCEARLLRRGGLPGLLWQLRFRYALLAGLCISTVAVGILSQFILTVRVSGNVEVPTGAILSQLRAQGVRPGAFGPSLDVRNISHGVILELPELSWMTINVKGTVAEVLVREGDPRPELVDEDVPAHIVAKHSGIITHMDATRGQAWVKKGDTVVAGDTLISSWVDFVEPPGATADLGGMLVRASGKVEARVWHTLKAEIPLEATQKVYSGREKARWSVEIFGHLLNFYRKGGISYGEYDKITAYHTAALPGDRQLPITLRKEVFREYTTQSAEIDRKKAETMLKAQLDQRLVPLVEDGEVLKKDYSAQVQDGLLTVTLVAECRQNIAQTVEEPVG